MRSNNSFWAPYILSWAPSGLNNSFLGSNSFFGLPLNHIFNGIAQQQKKPYYKVKIQLIDARIPKLRSTKFIFRMCIAIRTYSIFSKKRGEGSRKVGNTMHKCYSEQRAELHKKWILYMIVHPQEDISVMNEEVASQPNHQRPCCLDPSSRVD